MIDGKTLEKNKIKRYYLVAAERSSANMVSIDKYE